MSIKKKKLTKSRRGISRHVEDGSLFEDLSSDEIAVPTIVSLHLLPAKPTTVFDTYWKFAVERQRVFFLRFLGRPGPWTENKILQSFKFTNAYRASDRVSQYLIRQVIYREDLPSDADEVVFRILLFKLFNKIETWELLQRSFGLLTWRDFKHTAYDEVLSQAMQRGERIYSAAYIMHPGTTAFGQKSKHQNHLMLLALMLQHRLGSRLADARSMQAGFELLRSYPTIGDFLAYQLVTDVNYSEVTEFSEMEFVVPGPGALDGIRKCFADRGGLSEPELIRLMVDRQEYEFERLGLAFPSLWGRRLQLIDCQNLFCEIDKFARVAHPEVCGKSGRTRIKQKFNAHLNPLELWYPPKWGLSERIASGGVPNETYLSSPFAQ